MTYNQDPAKRVRDSRIARATTLCSLLFVAACGSKNASQGASSVGPSARSHEASSPAQHAIHSTEPGAPALNQTTTPDTRKSIRQIDLKTNLCDSGGLIDAVKSATSATTAACSQEQSTLSDNTVDIENFHLTNPEETKELATLQLWRFIGESQLKDQYSNPNNADGQEVNIDGFVCKLTEEGPMACFIGQSGLASVLLPRPLQTSLEANEAVMESLLNAASS